MKQPTRRSRRRSLPIATVTVSLPAEVAQAVDARVTALGLKSRSAYICAVLREDIRRSGNLVIRPEPPQAT